MAHLYADENFNLDAVKHLRTLGHDVLTVQEAGQQGCSDEEVLAHATTANRVLLTFNRRHFVKLHKLSPAHAGVVICTDDQAVPLAERVDRALVACPASAGQLIRVVRPPAMP
jgi:uncharacterized protein with PIN domain